MKAKKIKKLIAVAMVLSLAIAFTGCDNTDYATWTDSVEKESSDGADSNGEVDTTMKNGIRVVTDMQNSSGKSTADEMTLELLAENGDKLADQLWNTQIATGLYSVSDVELEKNSLTYYVSSSEGDDGNLGLSPDKPKKTLKNFSGISNITILLKCGDTFQMDNGFNAGSGCIYATYGTGPRPVVEFYLDFDREFTKCSNGINVWVADLTDFKGVYNTATNKDNCNIGQLEINGEVNWKRIVMRTAEAAEYDYVGSLDAAADGCWVVDWENSKLYMHTEVDPNTLKIRVAPDVTAISGKRTCNTVIKGWEITGAGAHGINLTNAQNVEIACCYLNNIGGSVHLSAGIRYGNAIQMWDGATNLLVRNNFADWIFDTCYTNQGSDAGCKSSNVSFQDNIGAHSFTGIETWGDTYSDNNFTHMNYSGNILFHMCDITDPYEQMFANDNGKLVGNESQYVSYRGGYTYNQMSSMNVTTFSDMNQFTITNNICWDTNRFMLMYSSAIYEEPTLTNNVFCGTNLNNRAALFRYKDEQDNLVYVGLPEYEYNLVSLSTGPTASDDAMQFLVKTMKNIAGL